MKFFKTLPALLVFACVIGLSGCETSDAVRQDGGALERELNYENAVQSEAAALGAGW